MKRIYLACPYSHKSAIVRNQRFTIANYVAHKLMKQGHIVFSPISHSVPIARWGGDDDHDLWLNQDKHFLDWATDIYIICMDGTYDSYGVNWETLYRDLPITFIDAITLEESNGNT